jgi:4-hydroxy-4-methyl-2-oxoglutarate aldolase
MSTVYEEFQKLPTTCISDALKGLNNMDGSIKPLKEEYKVGGPACTVKVLANDNLIVLKGIRMAKPGDVLVVDAKGYEYNAIAGDFVAGMAQTLGLAGIVADGTIRDILGVKKLNFPVFCKGTTVAAGGKAGIGEVNVPISCGGVPVNPGDIIIGDADGVVVVPQEQAQTVLQAAMDKEHKDQERANSVLASAEAVRKHLDKVTGN